MFEKGIKNFVRRHYRHFNAAVMADASQAYVDLLDSGGRMFLAMAGAMSTAELGISLAEMIRQDKISAISCTGANLEEDVFNLVAHDHYKRVPHYRHLTPREELELLENNLNRVTDTCIPEHEAMRKIEKHMIDLWKKAETEQRSAFPHEFLYELLASDKLKKDYQIPKENSWMLAAMEKRLPIFVPGWEDSTLGNIFTARCLDGTIENRHVVRTGIDYMMELSKWYEATTKDSPLGFFQIGGGIAGDFSICVVPMLRQDLNKKDIPLWAYFCQISDSTTSYGSYSGAVPNEKITWEKLGVDTPKFIIESDATIVAPIIFSYVMENG